MPVEPETQALITALESTGVADIPKGTVEQARAWVRLTTGSSDRLDPSAVAQIESSEDRTIDGPGGPLPIRIYRPDASGAVPTVMYFHGGGYVIGSIETHDDHCRKVCSDVNAVVVSVDYRLAPEHPFPAAFDDCLAATRWAADHIADLGGDTSRLAVAGDSAGANLAAAVAVKAATDGPPLAAQLVIYGKSDFTDTPYPSRVDNAEGYYLTQELADWFQDHYITPEDVRDPRASTLFAPDLTGVAPAVLGVGEYDVLRDEVKAYADRLTESGVTAHYHCFDGLIHGFYSMGLASPGSAKAVDILNSDFTSLLSS